MRHLWIGPLFGTVCIAVLLVLTLRPYDGNPSALFHYGSDQAAADLPAGVVQLDRPSYDGALYLRIALQVPLFLTTDGRAALTEREPKSYAYQRIALPVLAFLLAAGQSTWFPWTFLAINGAALLGAGVLVQKHTKNPLAAAALMLCPAATIGLHFSLAEPLTILLITAFLLRTPRVGATGALLLAIAVLTREIAVTVVLGSAIWFVLQRQWKNAAWMLLPACTFLLWHGVLFQVFHELPFLASAGKRDLPLAAVWDLVTGVRGYNAYTLSSIALLATFVVPTLAWASWQAFTKQRWTLEILGTIALLVLMLTMADDIWGSVTSIGRVITPVYPFAIAALATHDTLPARGILSATLLLGLMVGFSLALNVHPFHLA